MVRSFLECHAFTSITTPPRPWPPTSRTAWTGPSASCGATPRACITSDSRPRPRSTRPGARWRRSSAATPPRSSSPRVAPKATTSPFAALPRRSSQPAAAHLIATSIEHEAVLNTVAALAKRGWRVTLIGRCQRDREPGRAPRGAITDDTALVSVMHANNEIGTVQPLAELVQIAKARRAGAHRCGAERRQDPDRRTRTRCRSAVDLGPQVLRPERRRRAVVAQGRPPDPLHDRRSPGAQSPRRHRERAGIVGLGVAAARRAAP
jgi:hypothetical protein